MAGRDITPERYREEAARIRRSAARSPDEETRACLLLTARLYDQLAASMKRGATGGRRRNGAARSPRHTG